MPKMEIPEALYSCNWLVRLGESAQYQTAPGGRRLDHRRPSNDWESGKPRLNGDPTVSFPGRQRSPVPFEDGTGALLYNRRHQWSLLP